MTIQIIPQLKEKNEKLGYKELAKIIINQFFMSEAIIGVIVGGIIASTIPVITLFFDHKKWKSNHKIQNLRQKRDRLESKYGEIVKKLNHGMVNNSHNMNLIADFMVSFPEPVKKAFEEMMFDKEKHKDELTLKSHYLNIVKEMKKSLTKIEDEIDKEIN